MPEQRSCIFLSFTFQVTQPGGVFFNAKIAVFGWQEASISGLENAATAPKNEICAHPNKHDYS